MVHVIKDNGVVSVVAPETVGSLAVTDSKYIIAMPEDSELGVSFFGGEDEAHCIEVMGLVLQAEVADMAAGKAAIQAAGGLVFFEGVQQ